MSPFNFLNKVKKEEGAALVIALLILVLLTVIGVYAVFTSSVETRIAGYERLQEEAFYASDGGTDYGRTIIELVITNQGLPGGANKYDDPSYGTTLEQEIIGASGSNWEMASPGVRPNIGQCSTQIEINRIKVIQPEGETAAFGEPATEKEMTVYYRINSTAASTITSSASSQVETTYGRKVQ